MQLKELKDNLDKLPKEQAEAILNIIEHKTNDDMREVISEIRKLETKLESAKNEIKIVYWVIGIAMAVIVYLVARK
jgi:hypothetical protein